jgi:hypothetical protein
MRVLCPDGVRSSIHQSRRRALGFRAAARELANEILAAAGAA